MPECNDLASILQGAGEAIFKLVRDRASPAQWADWLRVPLEHAAGTGDHELVDKLLKAGANGSAGWRGCDHNTLLHAGALGGNPRVVSALIAAGAGEDMEARSAGYAYTPLHLAAMGGKMAAAKTLLLAGADVNPRCSNYTPLHLAIKHGHEEIAESLLSNGAHASPQSPNGTYPIHLAACSGYDGVVTKLLQNGATWDCLDAKGKTPLRLAALAGRVSTVKVLLLAGGGNDESSHLPTLHEAVCSDIAGIIPALVDGGADIEARSDQDLTPLFSAAYLGSCSASRALLQAGAAVNTTTADGSTPLHAAFCRGDYEMADLLLKWGADATAVDNRGDTPSQWMPKVSQTTSTAKRQELIRLSELLGATACRERAWRRRGLLVMCRAYPSKYRISPKTPRASDAYLRSPRRSSRRVACGSGADGMEVDSQGQQAGGGEGGTENGDGFGDVMAWLMELKTEDDGAFRSIVGFL